MPVRAGLVLGVPPPLCKVGSYVKALFSWALSVRVGGWADVVTSCAWCARCVCYRLSRYVGVCWGRVGGVGRGGGGGWVT